MNQSIPPARVRVTASRQRPRAPRRRSVRDEIDEQSPLGATYVDSLIRAQRRLALRTLGLGAAALGALPLLFAIIPATRELTIAGVLFPWLVLGIAIYPAAIITARAYTRAAERIERQFTRVVNDR
ncbi:hypothetical protein [Janibacter sp. GXQ6167]|uniref:hypothetical protein n=1 Tax=Janibacter sp. GXQ6167 TaxID=3240791 RepID=UPI00352575EE